MFISQKESEINLNHEPLNVFLLGMGLLKKGTDAMIPFKTKSTPVLTASSLNTPITIPSLVLRGRLRMMTLAG